MFMKDDLTRDLQKKLSYYFINIDFLLESITHKSYVNENPDLNYKDNERLHMLMRIRTLIIKTTSGWNSLVMQSWTFPSVHTSLKTFPTIRKGSCQRLSL